MSAAVGNTAQMTISRSIDSRHTFHFGLLFSSLTLTVIHGTSPHIMIPYSASRRLQDKIELSPADSKKPRKRPR
ncbi:hypothetical protein BDZ89DRAFT_241749 [Hymenopellis radicata]|nr:hypothetical protein BDZ89DRAFT_241749 [Hymenopellis radicata]